MILRGYMDESVKGKLFTLSCLISDGDTWSDLEGQWVDCLDAKNRELLKAGRKTIDRFHASDCNALQGRYEGWGKDERHEFQNTLVTIFNSHTFHVRSYGMSLDEFVEEVPMVATNPEGFAYVILLGNIMLDLADDLLAKNPEIMIRLFHDRCKYDAALIDMFNHTIESPEVEHRHNFVALSPEGWEWCIPLQPADMIAYENNVDLERVYLPRPRRWVLERIMKESKMGGAAQHFNRANLGKLHEIFNTIDESTKEILKVLARG